MFEGAFASLSRVRMFSLAVVFLAAAMLLSACGGGDEASEGGGADAGDGVESGAERTDSPGGGGTAGGTGEDEADGDAADGGEPGADIEALRALYLPGVTAQAELENMIAVADETEVNAIVVDVKEAGLTTYPSEVPLAEEIEATTEQIPDLASLVETLHDNDVYAIARLSVFQDDVLPNERPELAALDSTTGAPWLTYQGAAWSNPYREEAREYNIDIAVEAAEAGFDEIQFDYVRFPSDGTMANLEYGEETFPSQEEAIASFLEEANAALEPTGAMVSADVFGLVGVNDFVGVGQVVSMMSPHLDVLSPMVYPSHYPAGSYGYDNPDVEPYDIVGFAMEDFKQKGLEANPDLVIRPWLQDFDYISDYGPDDVQAQMDATYDSDLDGWILWNAAGDYTTEVLEQSSE